MTDTPATLKPCPFCGEIPTLGDNGGAGGEFWSIIHCNNPKCEIEPSAQCFGLPTLAIKDWNTRPLEEADRATIAEQAKEIERLTALLEEAIEDIASWSSYASDYFQQKHKLAKTLERYRAALSKPEPGR